MFLLHSFLYFQHLNNMKHFVVLNKHLSNEWKKIILSCSSIWHDPRFVFKQTVFPYFVIPDAAQSVSYLSLLLSASPLRAHGHMHPFTAPLRTCFINWFMFLHLPVFQWVLLIFDLQSDLPEDFLRSFKWNCFFLISMIITCFYNAFTSLSNVNCVCLDCRSLSLIPLSQQSCYIYFGLLKTNWARFFILAA